MLDGRAQRAPRQGGSGAPVAQQLQLRPALEVVAPEHQAVLVQGRVGQAAACAAQGARGVAMRQPPLRAHTHTARVRRRRAWLWRWEHALLRRRTACCWPLALQRSEVSCSTRATALAAAAHPRRAIPRVPTRRRVLVAPLQLLLLQRARCCWQRWGGAPSWDCQSPSALASAAKSHARGPSFCRSCCAASRASWCGR